VFHAIRVLIPCTVVAAAILLKESPDDPTAGTQATAAFACASTAAVCSLVQFPFSASIYFFYVAPLGALALLGALSWRPRAKILHAALLVAVVAFTVRYVTPGSVYSMGLVYAPNGSRHRLQLPRGRLLVTQEEKGEYEQLVKLVTKYARGYVILAFPDCPEVYFLSAKKNPTRALFDFLAPQRQEEVVATLDRAHPSLIVLNRWPGFSRPPASSLERLLEHRYPHVEHVGRFTVRWR
jgi:hypothetical protein